MQHLTHTSHQHGAALITALSILLLLTILGVSAMSTSALQERMAGNARDAEVAFEAAEFALRQAEAYVDTLGNFTDFSTTGGTGGKYLSSTTAEWKTESNWSTAGRHVTLPANTFMNLPQQPRYIIQIVDSTFGATGPLARGGGNSGTESDKPTVFQITARGYGLSSSSRVMLQSYYGTYIN